MASFRAILAIATHGTTTGDIESFDFNGPTVLILTGTLNDDEEI
jgi:hypothetical protein